MAWTIPHFFPANETTKRGLQFWRPQRAGGEGWAQGRVNRVRFSLGDSKVATLIVQESGG